MDPQRNQRNEKLARLYDAEILPIWGQRFGRLMLRELEVPRRAQILDVACGTGYPSLDLLARLDEQSRLIAIDSSAPMLDVARRKAGALSGKRVFFRTEGGWPKLTFASDVYDLVLSNLGLAEVPDPARALRELARVTKPAGQVVVTLPLHGTWAEFFDIYREVLTKHDRHELLERLEQHVAAQPEPDTLDRWLHAAGLGHTRIDVHEFSLLFRSSREFFFAPVIEYGPLATWKEIVGKGQLMQDVFWDIKQAIDAYFGSRAFQVTVKAGCARGVKVDPALASAGAGAIERVGEEEVIEVHTGEVELAEALASDDSEAGELQVFREPGLDEED